MTYAVDLYSLLLFYHQQTRKNSRPRPPVQNTPPRPCVPPTLVTGHAGWHSRPQSIGVLESGEVMIVFHQTCFSYDSVTPLHKTGVTILYKCISCSYHQPFLSSCSLHEKHATVELGTQNISHCMNACCDWVLCCPLTQGWGHISCNAIRLH